MSPKNNKKELRQEHIRQLIEQREQDELLSTRELAEQFDVSEMTIRRDLQELADAGVVNRQYGGALPSKDTLADAMPYGRVGMLLTWEQGKFANPFFNDVLEGVDAVLQSYNYRLEFLHTLAEIQTTQQAKTLLEQHPIRGLIRVGSTRIESIIYLESHVELTVTVLEPAPFGHNGQDAILFDGATGTFQLVEHLVQKGYKRIGFITGNEDSRLHGYMQGIAAFNLPADPQLCVLIDAGVKDWTIDLGNAGTEKLMTLPNPPDAIMCASDRIAMGALQWLHQHGYHVPNDIGVTGFDNIVDAALTTPPLTTVNVHKQLLGRLAAQRLFQRLQAPDEIPLKIITPVSLVVRDSC